MSFNILFDPNAFAEHDRRAKEAISGYLTTRGYDVLENPDVKGIDLIVSRSGEFRACIEAEVRKGWNQEKPFPWRTHQTSVRKWRHVGPSGNWLYTQNLPGSHAILTPLWDQPVQTVGKNVDPKRGYEKFFDLPTGKSVFLVL
jgi:hypothetical protein